MKKYVYWLLAIVITLVLSIYQRMTGPTHPKRVAVELNGESYKIKLPRSGVQHDEILTLKGVPSNTNAQLHYRRYPTSDDYTTVNFVWKDGECQAVLPVQPVAFLFKSIADLLIAHAAEFLIGQLGKVDALDTDRAAGGLIQTSQQVQEG